MYETRVKAIVDIFETADKAKRDFLPGEVASLIDSADGTRFGPEMLRAVNLSGIERQEAIAAVAADMKNAEVEQRTAAEAELRSLNAAACRLSTRSTDKTKEMEWRNLFPSRDELRALQEGVNQDGGFTVPQKVSGSYITLLRSKSVFLGAPGINVLPMDSQTLQLPQLSGTTGVAGPTAEGAIIADDDLTFSGPILTAYGYKALTKATAEILADSSLPLQSVIIGTLTRDIGQRIDSDLFGTATTGRLSGITATGNRTLTSLAAGMTVVSWTDVISAVADIEGTGGQATVIFANPAMAKGLRSERENGTSGAFLAGNVTDSPANRAQGLPLLVSNQIPARSVLVCDMTRVYVGARSVKVNISEHAFFDQDMVGVRLVHRIGGAVVAEPTSVQWIQAAAA